MDLDRALETRILIQANSGGGKSWLIRRLLEQTHKHVQQIILDLEGEFSTLRELYDYILVSDEGDIPVELKSAKLLAHKLLGLNVSAIIDLYELKPSQRLAYVRIFLDSMINAPKKLWHPCMVVVDEANHLCPQKGNAESAESVISLCQRGRKRGFCAVIATQRLSMLHKNSAAECNNKLIGRTGLDVDRKRASEELGFTSKEQSLALRTLKPGEFFAFGPAISDEVVKVKVGGVKSTHPRLGGRLALKPTPPTAKIKKVLSKLTDLPQEAVKEAKTVADFKKQITDLRRRLTFAERKIPVMDKNEINDRRKVVAEACEKAVGKAIMKERRAIQQEINSKLKVNEKVISDALDFWKRETLKPVFKLELGESPNLTPLAKAHRSLDVEKKSIKFESTPNKIKSPKWMTEFMASQIDGEGTVKLIAGEKRMLTVLCQRYPDGLTKIQLSLLADIKSSGGTWSTYLGSLRSKGLIEGNNDSLLATEEGMELLGKIPEPMSRDEIIQIYMNKLIAGEKRMLTALIEIYPEGMFKDQLSEIAEINITGGTWSTYLGKLRSSNLVVVQGGEIRASDELMQGE